MLISVALDPADGAVYRLHTVYLSTAHIGRVVFDLIDDRLRRSRGEGLREAADGEDPAAVSLGAQGADLDSLELLGVAGAVNEFFHLHETEVDDYLLRTRRIGDWAEIVGHGLEEGTSGITFETSGTTGHPKRVFHSWESLRQEADYLAETFADRRRVISTVPAHHIYGFLFTVLLPQQRSLSVRPMHWSRLGELRHMLEKRDLLVSHPELWRYLSRSIAGWPADVLGTSSTAPLRADIHRALLAGGLATLTEVYGSTETGGVGLRSQPEVPFELFPYLSRSESPALCRVLPSGDTVRVELRDRIEWHDERHFVPQGRLDRVVQVGGENVSLQRVEDVLSEVPGIAGATVHAVEVDGILRLEARLRRAPDEAGVLPSRQAVMEVARRRLRPTERPVAVTFSEA